MNKKQNKQLLNRNTLRVIKKAKQNFTIEISADAINKKKINSISPLDACTCTGNCSGGGGGSIISIT